MFRKILVALDRSHISRHVFEQAIAFAKATKANLMLLHVLSHGEEGCPELPTYPYFSYYPQAGDQLLEVYLEEWEKYSKRGLEFLRSLHLEAIAAGVNADFTQIAGDPGLIICDLAQTWEADLILMGRRGHSGLNELFLGSVSNYVLHHAPCSVLTLQTHAKVKPETPQQSNLLSA
jgi:nucleotide-binding universal stress UspA family protein